MDHRPVNDFIAELEQSLDTLRGQSLFRELRRVDSPQSAQIQIGGKTLLNFSSNDYLGLANHPALKTAAVRAIEKFGVGSGASRLVCGSLAPFHELEESLAYFKRTQAALTFSSGYATAIGTLCALLGRDDTVILDKLVHACIIDAAKLSGAKIRVFAHNDLADLEDKLTWAKSQSGKQKSRTLVVTETIFSMDGDAAPLREIVGLKNKFGAWLMVDEAHATGVVGGNGRGLADEAGIAAQIEIQMGTLGKGLGTSGGYICGSRPLVDLLVNRARTFIFSTAPVPASAAAATAAIQLLQSPEGEQRRNALHQRLEQFNSNFHAQNPKPRGAIIPIVLGDEDKALAASAKLREQGIFIPAIRFPTVARGKARLRLTLNAAHSASDVSTLVDALKALT
ncbi:MAG TPA: 8-amino-7-oxononanoate synthase [Verrucomicrobiae bacterium]|nr:8-amino-7-oxononanoate synthase [Verrucomicrobiae bacterium]